MNLPGLTAGGSEVHPADGGVFFTSRLVKFTLMAEL